jgi:4-amino-4-deoxy-L-arabinose transferase-like glycosyltransferase
MAFRREPGRFRPSLMLLIWAVFIFAFFSKSSSKLPGYILPIFPALALLIAVNLELGSRRSRMIAAGMVSLLGAALLALVPFIPRFKHHPGEIELLQAFQPWVLAGGFIALVGGALALLYARQLKRDLTVLALALAGFASTELLLTGFETYGAQRAGRYLVAVIQPELTPGSRVFSVGTYEQSMTFYLGRTVTLVDYTDEFSFGLKQQPELAIPTLPEFVNVWTRDARAGRRDVAIIRADLVDQLTQQGVPMRVLARDARRTIIVNQADNAKNNAENNPPTP